MDLTRTSFLGLIAGVTILIGLPVGRLRSPAPAMRALLNASAVGVLLFLVWDVLSAAWEPIDVALAGLHDGSGGLGPAAGYGLLFAGGLAVGLLGLVGYENWMGRQVVRAKTATTDPDGPRFGPGAMSATEASARAGLAGWSAAERLALLIAVGIGLHNFAEGLAIGQSAASGEIGLATLLVVGFALHNATEGFGIVAPLAARADATTAAHRPSWGFLLALGAIGGGPTFIGTLVGHSVTSEPLAVLFLTLAAGSIVYVITQLLYVAARSARRDLVAYGLLIGLLAGFLTDAIVTAAGV
ncbi:MAG TPA: ZIP family metal transporter [Kineosporiaceae bacterium]|nr:ZIP family metal transporter [Kineosporiaceae bacterium]